MSEFPRQTAKGLLWTPDRERVLALQTPSGLWTLPGGGIDIGETARQAFGRELREELPGVLVYDVSKAPIMSVEGDIPGKYPAQWEVFSGSFWPLPRGYRLPPEHRAYGVMTPEELLRENRTSFLVKRVLEQTVVVEKT